MHASGVPRNRDVGGEFVQLIADSEYGTVVRQECLAIIRGNYRIRNDFSSLKKAFNAVTQAPAMTAWPAG